jgi:AcrR family transcriptional regulator
MARRPNPQRKQELLAGIVAFAASNGLGDLSLRPLAAALGTSTYTLTYQFGSKEELIVDTLNYVEGLHTEALGATFEVGASPKECLNNYWSWLSDPTNSRIVRILFEATTIGMSGAAGYSDFRRRLVDSWRKGWTAHLVGLGMDASAAEEKATLVTAALLGLTFDLLSTADTERLTHVVDVVGSLVEPQAAATV